MHDKKQSFQITNNYILWENTSTKNLLDLCHDFNKVKRPYLVNLVSGDGKQKTLQ